MLAFLWNFVVFIVIVLSLAVEKVHIMYRVCSTVFSLDDWLLSFRCVIFFFIMHIFYFV